MYMQRNTKYTHNNLENKNHPVQNTHYRKQREDGATYKVHGWINGETWTSEASLILIQLGYALFLL
jgi:hypothetical protein